MAKGPKRSWFASRQEHIQDEIGRAILAVVIVVLHTAVSAAIICCMWLMERLILVLWNGQEPIITGVPLHTIMLGAEVIVLIVFLGAATISAALAFWR